MQTVRVANPGPAALMVLNPSKRRSMATKKRRTTRRKPARRHHNPQTTTTRRRRSTTTYASGEYKPTASFLARRRNPARKHRRPVRRHRNPHATGLLMQGLELAAGAALVQFTLGFVPPIGGVSPLADAARTAGTGYLLSVAMNKTGVARQYANSVALAGFTLAGGKLITSFLLPFANRIFRPSQAPTQQVSNGVGGIALVTAVPPALVPKPVPVRTAAGVSGFAPIPGMRY